MTVGMGLGSGNKDGVVSTAPRSICTLLRRLISVVGMPRRYVAMCSTRHHNVSTVCACLRPICPSMICRG